MFSCKSSIAVVAVLVSVSASITFAQAPNEAALAAYGGYAGLGKITHDFVERVQKNPRIASFFTDADIDRREGRLTDQFCDVLGGEPQRFRSALRVRRSTALLRRGGAGRKCDSHVWQCDDCLGGARLAAAAEHSRSGASSDCGDGGRAEFAGF